MQTALQITSYFNSVQIREAHLIFVLLIAFFHTVGDHIHSGYLWSNEVIKSYKGGHAHFI